MQIKARILYLEDHEDTRELVTFVLEKDNYKVTSESTLRDALELARTQRFDLFLLDSWLVDGSGVEFCQRVREFDPMTPILFYSGAAFDSDKLKAIRAGAQGYLVKPCSFSDLLRTISRLLTHFPNRSPRNSTHLSLVA